MMKLAGACGTGEMIMSRVKRGSGWPMFASLVNTDPLCSLSTTRGMLQHYGLHKHGSAFVYGYPNRGASNGIWMLFFILADILIGLMLLGLPVRPDFWP